MESCGTRLALTKVTSWDSASGPQYRRISTHICDIGLIKISMDVDLHIVYFFQRWNGNQYSGTRRYTSEGAFISPVSTIHCGPQLFCGLRRFLRLASATSEHHEVTNSSDTDAATAVP
jgi:hypothetical protein